MSREVHTSAANIKRLKSQNDLHLLPVSNSFSQFTGPAGIFLFVFQIIKEEFGVEFFTALPDNKVLSNSLRKFPSG